MLLRLLLLGILSFSVYAEQEVVDTFGAWSKICAEVADAPIRCQIVQSASQNETKQLVFQTAVGFVDGSDKPIMFLTAPLGIFLPKGVTVIVGEETEGLTATVQRCDGKGCLALMAMEPEFVAKLEKGISAKIYFGANKDRTVALPLDLTGFKKGLRSLK